MNPVLQDIRYGFRMLRKSPGISAAAALTLALGIGANTTIFSVMNSVFFRPLPFRDADRLVILTERHVKNQDWQRLPAMGTIFDWEKNTRSFEQIELAVTSQETANLTLGNETEKLNVQWVTPGLPDMLGIKSVLGPGFHASPNAPDGTSNVVISYAMWQRHWGGDPAVLGRTIRLPDGPVAIVGVAPPNAWVYPWLKKIDVWWVVDPAREPKEFFPELRWMGAIGRLKPGIPVRQAQAEMAIFGQRLAQMRPETNREWTADALPLQEAWFGSSRKLFYLLLGAVGFVLFIACANVANLLLARAGARTTEMAIRASIGGTRSRIVRQLLTESFVLAMIGGLLGLALSYGGVRLFMALVPRIGTLVDTVAIDARVMLFTLALALVTGLVFGAVPAIRLSTYEFNRTLKEGGARSGGGTRNAAGNLLVIGELALTMILLAGAGLMVNSFVRLMGTGLGFNPSNLLTADVQLDGTKYRQILIGDLQRVTPASDDFFRQTVEHLRRAPGVVSAGLEGATGRCFFRIAGRSDSGRPPETVFAEIDDGFFHTMQIPLLAGRDVSAQDDALSPWVAVINAALAKRHFPGENPVGKHIHVTHTDASGRLVPEPNARTIVAIAGDARELGPRHETQPMMYLPYRQHISEYLGGNGHTHLSKRLLIRSWGNPLALTRTVRAAAGEVDRTQVVHNIESMEQIMAERVAPSRFSMQIFGVLAGIALALAAVGIFGVMSYTVSRRTHEIGIRMALGASVGDVLGLVMKDGLSLTLPGIGLGIAGALGLTRFVTSMLYGVPPADPLTFSMVTLVLMGVALSACYFPARRAMSVDPVRALRDE